MKQQPPSSLPFRRQSRDTERSRKCPLTLVPLALLALLAGGCGGGGGGGDGSPLATVSGRVLDDVGEPVVGALVVISSDPVSVTTDASGRFLVLMEAGSHHMQVSANGLQLCEACFSLEKRQAFDLGDLYPGRSSGCGGPTFCAGDMDCDGISDLDELQGWEVRVVLGDGVTVETRNCVSDPTRKDTDGDGLSDLEELAARTDPGRRDTDGDLLPDFGELNAYKSNPCKMDSDDDSRGPDGTAISDPNLWDGFELRYLRTSPTLADTDGDGLSDWEEVHSGGTDPRIADLPAMDLEIHGDPALVLDITATNNETTIESTLEKDAASYEKTDTESTKMSIENTVKVHTELEAGTGTWPPSFNAKITTDTQFKHGYFSESMSSWTESSVQESQQRYESQTEFVTSWDDGRLAIAVKIANSSDLSFKVKDLRITAYRQGAGGSFSPIGNLVAGDGFLTEDVPGSDPPRTRKVWNAYPDHEFILGPGAEVTLLVGADSLPTQIMRALVANPTALLLEVGSYSLFQLDDLGVNETVNFAKLGEDVIQRTGLIVIDYGDGNIERHMVATNVFRHPDGSGRGLSLGEALRDVIGLDHDSEVVAGEERRVLTRIRTRAYYAAAPDAAVRGFWVVGGNGTLFDQPLAVDFDDIVLRAGERVSLTYVQDRDGDGLFDREEYLLGTQPTEVDTDRDGLDDYVEAKEGWQVAVHGRTPYAVFPDPRFLDLDGDYLSDLSERSLGTDPFLKDSDGDGDSDAFDPDPLVPPCLDGEPLNLEAWWDGTIDPADPSVALDVGVGRIDATLSDPAIAFEGVDIGRVFRLNGDRNPPWDWVEAPGRVVISPAEEHTISPTREYTVAMWLQWFGNASGQGSATLLAKGPFGAATYGVAILGDGTVRHTLRRRYTTKCWYLGSDPLCSDSHGTEQVTQTTPERVAYDDPGQPYWVHVVATCDGEWMRVYADGELAVETPLRASWTGGIFGSYRYERSTDYLIGSSDLPLTVGLDPDGGGQAPFCGFLDDVQYLHRALTADEVRQLYGLGVCRD